VLPEATERAISAAYNVPADKRSTPKELEASLQAAGHKVSLRTIQRRYEKYDDESAAHAATPGAQRWRLIDARSAEELALILPALATSVGEGRELSKDEAAIFLAFRRALPQAHPGFLLFLTHHYERARRDETPIFGPTWSDYSVDEIEKYVALAHVDQTQPGTLEKAINAGQVRKIGTWAQVSVALVVPRTHSCGRKFWDNTTYRRHMKDCDATPVVDKAAAFKGEGGTRHGKKK
jgi:hypothetical protein